MNRIRKVVLPLLVITLLFVVFVLSPTCNNKPPTDQEPFALKIPLNRSTEIKEKKLCTIILRERSGRFGNRLFMFASALGLSLKHSCSLAIDKLIVNELKVAFDLNVTLDLNFSLILDRSPNNHTWIQHRIHNHCSFLTLPFQNQSLQSLELLGFWQVHKYFSNYSSEIRQQFRFKNTILNRVYHFFNSSINPNISTRVGIHIRRGDFLLVRRVSSDQYVYNAMAYFKRKYQSMIFIIVTDDRSYCGKVYSNRVDVVFTPKSFDGPTDLAVLSECDHVIMTVGTFGWWAGFLLRNPAGEVLTDAKADFSPIDANCKSEDYFPPWFSFLNRTKL